MPIFNQKRTRSNKQTMLQNQINEQEYLHTKYLQMLEAEKLNEQKRKGGMAWKIVKQGWDGVVNVARSMNTPNTNRRPKISQLPAHRSDMDISKNADLRSLVSPNLRKRDIRGKRVDPKDFYRTRKELRGQI